MYFDKHFVHLDALKPQEFWTFYNEKLLNESKWKYVLISVSDSYEWCYYHWIVKIDETLLEFINFLTELDKTQNYEDWDKDESWDNYHFPKITMTKEQGEFLIQFAQYGKDYDSFSWPYTVDKDAFDRLKKMYKNGDILYYQEIFWYVFKKEN